MGWNQGYTIFESTVIGAYDLAKLDKALLKVLMEPYRDTDIDSGGSHDLETHDGKSVMEVVIEIMGSAMPARPEQDEDTEEGEEAWLEYHEDVFEAFYKIASKQFGWG